MNAAPVRQVRADLSRERGTAQRKATIFTAEFLHTMLGELPEGGVRGREHALMLVGFAALLRRSKLARLDVGNVVFTDQVSGGPAPYMPT